MTARAQAPSAPIRWRDTIPDNTESTLEATVASAVHDFGRTVGVSDGTRSQQILDWSAEFERVVQRLDA